MKRTLNMIWAMDEESGIGKDNKLPWTCKEDLRLFSKLTKGQDQNQNKKNIIVMGRKTWESIGKRDLPGRANIVLSKDYTAKDFMNNLDNGMFPETKFGDVWIIGGATIYKWFIEYYPERLGELHCSLIPGTHACDTFFPQQLLEKQMWSNSNIHITYHNMDYHLSSYHNIQ